MFKQRKKGVVFTDSRVRLTTEVLQGIRLIKFYVWEVRWRSTFNDLVKLTLPEMQAFYAHKIGELRKKEVRTIKLVA
jgi:ATP-binding cassette, subfamily C (CFTR/MRP), member 1